MACNLLKAWAERRPKWSEVFVVDAKKGLGEKVVGNLKAGGVPGVRAHVFNRAFRAEGVQKTFGGFSAFTRTRMLSGVVDGESAGWEPA